MAKGWQHESARHSLAARGMKTKCPPKKSYASADAPLERRADIEKLKKFLLENFGGKSFQIDSYLYDQLSKKEVRKLFSEGRSIRGEGFELQKMETSGCHQNSAVLAAINDWDIYTGIALSKDGVWRVHSWVQDSKDKTWVETTERRVVYYGYKLDEKEKTAFIKGNVDIDEMMEGRR